MKNRIVLLSLFLCLAFLNAFSQSKWTLRQPNVGPRAYVGIRMVDSLRGYAIGQSPAQNAVTINGGNYWARRKNNLLKRTGYVAKCFFVKPTLAYHTANAGLTLCRITNAGLTIDTISQIKKIWDIWFADSLQGYSIRWNSDNIDVGKTTDGGRNWTMMSQWTNVPVSVSRYRITGRTSTELWLSNDTSIRKSTDSGATWSKVIGPFLNHKIGGIKWINTNVGFIQCDSSRYYKTTNAGTSWEKGIIIPDLGNGFPDNIRQIDFVNTNTGFALLSTDLYKTTNGGTNWTKILNPFKSDFGPFHLVTDQKIWITTDGGIAKSENGGITWTQQTKGTDAHLINSCIQSSNRAWAIGGNTVLNTKDRGRTWTEINIDADESFGKIIFPRPDVGYLLGFRNLYRSTDGGESWVKKGPEIALNSYYTDIQFLNADTGFLSTYHGLYVTTDKGDSWTQRFTIQDNMPIISFYFSDFKHCFLLTDVLNKPKTYRTKDNGLTWEKDTLTWQDGNVFGMHFTDSLNGVIYYGSTIPTVPTGLHKSTDGGATWNYFGNPQPNGMQNLFYGGNNAYYTSTYPNLFRKSESGGSFWVEGDSTDQPNFNSHISFFKNKPVLVVGQGGAIYTADDWTGQDTYVATGKIVKKRNNDCIQDANEVPIPYQIVVANPGNYFGSTESNGNYYLNTDTGSYAIKQIKTSRIQATLSTQYCPPVNADIPLHVTDLLDTVSGNNFINDVRFCPILVVEQNHQRMRPCRRSRLTITVGNEGNMSSESEYLFIKFPAPLHLISANSIYDYNATDSTFRFIIKPLQPNESVSISIIDSVSCLPNQLTGQTLCVKASIPNAPNCLIQYPNWDGADLEVASICLPSGQSRFKINNKGATMSQTALYEIFIDATLVYQASFQLAANEAMTVTLPTNTPAGFARLVVPQSANHPLSTFASAEANCATGMSTNGMFPPPDQSPLVDIECVTVTNAFDPNDKQVFPRGWGTAGNVLPETEFKYTIRFQNTGTDTTFKVVLVDTLDDNLDIASLQIGNASHPYNFKVSGKGRPVLNWTFDNILLPDSGRNMEASNGFVSFSIRPKTGLALGTRLENFADIYFDFNDPIRTNTTLNTLWIPTLTTGILDTVFVNGNQKLVIQTKMQIHPNPSKGQLEALVSSSGNLQIYDLRGILIETRKVQEGLNSFNLSTLPKGLYWIKLQTENGVATQKLVLE